MNVQYKCNDCGRRFTYAEERKDVNGEPYTCCPFCRSDDYEEQKQCPLCDIWFDDDGEEICVGCRETAVIRFQRFMERFRPQEREYINKCYEGVEL